MLIELEIHATAGSAQHEDGTMILLKEKGGERMLPIMTSHKRAMILLMRDKLPLQLPVPVSAVDACRLMMLAYGIKVKGVVVTALKEGAFFCNVMGDHDGEEHIVNFAQAQDGLIIATCFQCPIYIDEELLDAQYMRKLDDNSFALNINTLSRSMLEDALQHAIDNENYEAASYLRDELAKRTTTE